MQQLERNRIGRIAGRRNGIARVPQGHRYAADNCVVAGIGSTESGRGIKVAGIDQEWHIRDGVEAEIKFQIAADRQVNETAAGKFEWPYVWDLESAQLYSPRDIGRQPVDMHDQGQFGTARIGVDDLRGHSPSRAELQYFRQCRP